MNEIDWQKWRNFHQVATLGSLSAAARHLRISQPTLGRQMTELEQQLGLSLFTRSQKGLKLTPEAERLLPLAAGMAAAAEALIRSASSPPEEVAGVVRISASETFGAEVLPPILRDLCDLHPGVSIELVLSNQLSDLLSRDADIAIRMTTPTQDALLARKIGDSELGLFAHRDYLARHGTPRSLEEVTRHRIIGFDRRAIELKQLPGLDRSWFRLRTDFDLAGLAALRAGFGIGVCHQAVARRDGALLRVLPELFSLFLPVWVVMHEDLRRARVMRASFDALSEGLKAYIS